MFSLTRGGHTQLNWRLWTDLVRILMSIDTSLGVRILHSPRCRDLGALKFVRGRVLSCECSTVLVMGAVSQGVREIGLFGRVKASFGLMILVLM